MAVQSFKIKYGDTVYEYSGAGVRPESFRLNLERNAGTVVPWGNGTASTVDPEDADSAFHFLVDGVYGHAYPDEIIELVDDQPAGTWKG